MRIDLVALVVEDYDEAIEFLVEILGFDLVEDSPALTNDGRRKRWVVVRPPEAQTGLLLAQADGEDQSSVIGNGVQFLTTPRTENYGQVAVFLDVAGNRWDLLGPAEQ